MNEVVQLERRDIIGIVTVNSPPVNALSAAVRGGILECMKSAITDPEIKAIVLTCAGRTFIAGADITEFGKPPKPPGLQEVLTEMENSPKPIVAAIHGTALGGGLEVALACHFRVATKDARLGLPEVKLGLLPGAGGTQRLPRLVGKGLALQLILSGEMISAQEAYRIGLVNEVVPRDQLIPRAEAVLRQIGAHAPLAVKFALEAVNQGLEAPQDQGLSLEASLFGLCAATEDKAEGTLAFLSKRAPNFQGR